MQKTWYHDFSAPRHKQEKLSGLYNHLLEEKRQKLAKSCGCSVKALKHVQSLLPLQVHVTDHPFYIDLAQTLDAHHENTSIWKELKDITTADKWSRDHSICPMFSTYCFQLQKMPPIFQALVGAPHHTTEQKQATIQQIHYFLHGHRNDGPIASSLLMSQAQKVCVRYALIDQTFDLDKTIRLFHQSVVVPELLAYWMHQLYMLLSRMFRKQHVVYIPACQFFKKPFPHPNVCIMEYRSIIPPCLWYMERMDMFYESCVRLDFKESRIVSLIFLENFESILEETIQA